MTDQRDGGIAWTDETWNPLRGCSKVSAGCTHCYAETMATRFSGPGQPYEGTIRGKRWNGVVKFVPERLHDPLRWQRPRLAFVNSMSDLFHESVPFETVAAIFGVMAAASSHTFQTLTKRPERMLAFFQWLAARSGPAMEKYEREFAELEAQCIERGKPHMGRPKAPTPELRAIYDAAPLPNQECHWRPWPLPNVWLGVSIENQKAADERIPLLLQCPAAVRWVSAEPLLGPVNLRPYLQHASLGETMQRLANAVDRGDTSMNLLDWVVVGGESGPDARPLHPDWVRSLRDQCVEDGTAFFFKQWGDWSPRYEVEDTHNDPTGSLEYFSDIDLTARRVGKKVAGRTLDGQLWDQYPTVSR